MRRVAVHAHAPPKRSRNNMPTSAVCGSRAMAHSIPQVADDRDLDSTYGIKSRSVIRAGSAAARPRARRAYCCAIALAGACAWTATASQSSITGLSRYDRVHLRRAITAAAELLEAAGARDIGSRSRAT